ncbi:hypothetical protein AB1Y20_004279 [Prymnesium parvum]|uniref:Glycosyltransferase 61 catalytic domain-containing protein n=1 Tax=Prymnesium parvum TaxID=97485 RepID=A0AB34J754_PRYPA
MDRPVGQCLLAATCLILATALVIKRHSADELPYRAGERPANSSCQPLAASAAAAAAIRANESLGLEFVDSQNDFSPSVFCGRLFHFMEFAIAAFVLLQQQGVGSEQVAWVRVYHGVPPRVLPLAEWEGGKSKHNLALLRRLWPRATAAPRDAPPVARRLAVDRWSCDYGAELVMLLKFAPHFEAHAWHRALGGGGGGGVVRAEAVRVTYIERQAGKRQLADEAHAALVRVVGALPGVRLKLARLDTSVDLDEQIPLMQATDVLIGVHGNGLTSQMFMRPRRYVVEIFPKRAHVAFRFDYSLLSKLMAHEHLLIHNGTQASLQLMTHDLLAASRLSESASERAAERQRAALLAGGGAGVADRPGQSALGSRSKADGKATSKVWSLASKLRAIDNTIWKVAPSSNDLDPTALRAIVGLIERAQQELMRR